MWTIHNVFVGNAGFFLIAHTSHGQADQKATAKAKG
jgi:hypothetical protein